MIEFKVWTDGYNGEEDPHTVFAHDAESAARMFVEENHSDLDYASEVEVVVLTPSGEKVVWTVTAEETVTFSAVKKISP